MKSAGPGLFLIYLLGFFVIMMSTKAADEQVRPASSTRQPGDTEPVIIVGSGLAGLVAALEAVRNGAFVVIIDGEKEVGGNSAKASSGMSGCGTVAQKRLGIVDSTDRFYADTMAAGDRENDASLVDILVHDSAASIEFLMTQGVDLSDVNLCGGHSVPRLHWIPSPKEGKPTPVGLGIIKALKAKLDELSEVLPGVIIFRMETEVVGLVTWNEYITGVRVKTKGQSGSRTTEEISGKAVILATGGYANDHDNETSLLAEFAPDKLNFPTTNGKFAQGKGVKMARAMGAQLVGMSDVQIHPTAFIDPKNPTDTTKFLAAEALRGKGAILVNEKGERFGNELGRRDYLTGKILTKCAKNPDVGGARTALMLMTDEMADAFGRPAFTFYAKVKGFFKVFDNAKSLANNSHMDTEQLEKTLTGYNHFVAESAKDKDGGIKDEFDKSIFPAAFDLEKPIYAALVTPAIHYTMGGLKIDKQARVFNEFSQTPFKGLFAAGEVTGGVHGKNRLAGNSLLECVVFGRIAGRNGALVSYANEPVTFAQQQPHGEL